MKRISTLAIVLAALLASGCGEEEACACSVERTGELLTYERSGGIDPAFYRVEINQEGRAVVESGNYTSEPRRRVVELSEAEVDDLREVLEENPIGEFPEVDPDVICADCFEYSLTYGGATYSYDNAVPDSDSLEAVEQAIGELPLPPDTPTGLS